MSVINLTSFGLVVFKKHMWSMCTFFATVIGPRLPIVLHPKLQWIHNITTDYECLGRLESNDTKFVQSNFILHWSSRFEKAKAIYKIVVV